ncbi:hypothetical protein H6S82_06340 [Planktothrix sp. FACHB-1355]|uniref:Uncharacterized protein n=1 Tax=Aerosakkonema funiforme FACHB-1375 TaxID=2949571 RepID=A0A926ZH33_9CYAN|nr:MULTISPECIES: hypothetical protein [Oscillatoriales]MBD2181747.1 hypothetical protein [Aerosakkonema funiforme FACHB-1375]MBD3558473.1 hypothetical protein [Planktothrix sp. FACHB-1355]
MSGVGGAIAFGEKSFGESEKLSPKCDRPYRGRRGDKSWISRIKNVLTHERGCDKIAID